MPGVVSIGRDEVHGFMLQKPCGGPLHALTPETCQGIRCDLHRAPQLHELDHALRSHSQDGIALRVSEDRGYAAFAQFKETVANLRRNTEVAQLNQEVAAADGVAVRIGKNELQMIVRKMEVAAQAQLGEFAHQFLQSSQAPSQASMIVMVTFIEVRRGDHVSDAVGRRHPAHFHGRVPRLGSVVYLGQNVAVGVDHAL